MKNIFTLIAVLFLSFTALNAQMVEQPLEDKVSSEFIPEAPTSNHTYVKGHYEYKSGKYYWVDGAYVLNAPNRTWVDGTWVKDEATNMYTLNEGHWEIKAEVIVHNGIAYEPAVVTELSTIEMTSVNMLSAVSE